MQPGGWLQEHPNGRGGEVSRFAWEMSWQGERDSSLPLPNLSKGWHSFSSCLFNTSAGFSRTLLQTSSQEGGGVTWPSCPENGMWDYLIIQCTMLNFYFTPASVFTVWLSEKSSVQVILLDTNVLLDHLGVVEVILRIPSWVNTKAFRIYWVATVPWSTLLQLSTLSWMAWKKAQSLRFAIFFHITLIFFPPKVGAEGEKSKPLGAEGSEGEEDCHTDCIGGGRSQKQVPAHDSHLILLLLWTICSVSCISTISWLVLC